MRADPRLQVGTAVDGVRLGVQHVAYKGLRVAFKGAGVACKGACVADKGVACYSRQGGGRRCEHVWRSWRVAAAGAGGSAVGPRISLGRKGW